MLEVKTPSEFSSMFAQISTGDSVRNSSIKHSASRAVDLPIHPSAPSHTFSMALEAANNRGAVPSSPRVPPLTSGSNRNESSDAYDRVEGSVWQQSKWYQNRHSTQNHITSSSFQYRFSRQSSVHHFSASCQQHSITTASVRTGRKRLYHSSQPHRMLPPVPDGLFLFAWKICTKLGYVV